MNEKLERSAGVPDLSNFSFINQSRNYSDLRKTFEYLLPVTEHEYRSRRGDQPEGHPVSGKVGYEWHDAQSGCPGGVGDAIESEICTTPSLPNHPGNLSDSRCNSSSTEAGVLVAITGHGLTPPEGGTYYRWWGQRPPLLYPQGKREPAYLSGSLSYPRDRGARPGENMVT
ncbi:hypothetical protein AVEN_74492-1 [Araneus ventricosus]|uniref:Uncharacterized protein n=1 Tax=Araneus ventricosus TaxID=182803 RepID=A0A4Y2CAD7_ARAVE|nr:hypothetical protein AVEN_181096-1 [Araneus ventricosus]GBM00781.1 hypothetical protein AVEN_74492-1 [Araneus ventricosus]